MLKFLFSVLIVLLPMGLLGQKLELLMTNSLPLDESRYKGIEGSPFLYEQWMLARVINFEGDFIDSVYVNYNGHTQNFEATDFKEYVSLNEDAHGRIEVYRESGDMDIFIRTVDTRIKPNYILQHYNGREFQWVSGFDAKLEERVIETPGKTTEIKQFVRQTRNLFIVNGNTVSFKMKKKKILGELDDFGPASKLAKDNSIDVETKEGLIELLTLLDES